MAGSQRQDQRICSGITHIATLNSNLGGIQLTRHGGSLCQRRSYTYKHH
jgi:hypothetical protein